MTTMAIITIVIILLAVLLFTTDWLPSDLVAVLAMIALVVFGVITPEEGISGFSNPATVTVAFMFVISAALLKTGALQVVTLRLSSVFRHKFMFGMISMMLMVAVISAFINNTPVVAFFIPVVLQIAHASGRSPAKMLIPLSFASVFGGMCTLIGTSTNLLVSGIAVNHGLEPIGMFDFTLMGMIFLAVGVIYMALVGIKLLPLRQADQTLGERYDLRNYLAEIQLLPHSTAVGNSIMDTEFVKELGIDIIEVRRNDTAFHLPPGDFILEAGDVLKVRCNVDKLKLLKDRERIAVNTGILIGDNDFKGTNAALVEMVITANSEFSGKSLKEMDFRRRFRAVPLGICHRDEVLHEELYKVELKPGDVILAEVKKHYIPELKKLETAQNPPFILLSEDHVTDFDRPKFAIVMSVIVLMISFAALGILDIVAGVIAAVGLLVLTRCLNMKEVYEAINWKVVFLMAGVLSFGTAMSNTQLDQLLAGSLIGPLGIWGPIAILSGIYLLTSFLTEIMSNAAAAALMAPIAIATAVSADLNALPFLMAVMFSASASFATPIGYQTNTMVFSAGQYRFKDFLKVGVWLNLLFWLVATLTIPVFYAF